MLDDEEIKRYLEGCNVKKLAILTEISPYSIYGFMKGRDIRHSLVVRISNYFEDKEQPISRTKKMTRTKLNKLLGNVAK